MCERVQPPYKHTPERVILYDYGLRPIPIEHHGLAGEQLIDYLKIEL